MERNKIIEVVVNAIKDVADIEDDIDIEQKIEDIPDIDSLALIQVLALIKSKTGVSLAMSEISHFVYVKDIVDAIEKRSV